MSHGACKSQWLQQGFTTRIFVLRRHSSQKKDRDEAAKTLHIIERKYHVELKESHNVCWRIEELNQR